MRRIAALLIAALLLTACEATPRTAEERDRASEEWLEHSLSR